MNFSKLISFVFSPKSYIKNVVTDHKQNFVKNLLEKQNLIPIDNTNDEDIFIVGFPKSGNTWMQSLISGLYFGIDAQYLPDSLSQDLVPDVHKKKYYTRFGEIAFFKSHSLPQKHYKKVIYIVRDGRDAMVSYYHFNQKLGRHFTYDQMIEKGSGMIPCQWHQHVSSWLKNPFNAEIYFLKYEDLLNNCEQELKKICQFIGIERSEELIKKVVDGNSFAKMKEKAQKYGGLGQKNWKGEKGKEFFRKGQEADYKNHLSMELIEKFNKQAFQELKHFNYEI